MCHNRYTNRVLLLHLCVLCWSDAVTSRGQGRTSRVTGQQEGTPDFATSNNGQCPAGLSDCETGIDDDDDEDDDDDDDDDVDDECSATSSSDNYSEDELDARRRNRRSPGKRHTC